MAKVKASKKRSVLRALQPLLRAQRAGLKVRIRALTKELTTARRAYKEATKPAQGTVAALCARLRRLEGPCPAKPAKPATKSPKRAPKPSKPAQAPKAEAMTLDRFATKVQDVADHSPRVARFHGDRSFISSVYDAIDWPLSFDAFKARLVEAHRANLLRLTRAELVSAMDPELVERSATHYHNATFHFVASPDKL
jgi:hypothetical protein